MFGQHPPGRVNPIVVFGRSPPLMTQAELDALIERERKPLALELTVADWELVAPGAISYRGLPIFLTERRSRVVSKSAWRGDW